MSFRIKVIRTKSSKSEFALYYTCILNESEIIRQFTSRVHAIVLSSSGYCIFPFSLYSVYLYVVIYIWFMLAGWLPCCERANRHDLQYVVTQIL